MNELMLTRCTPRSQVLSSLQQVGQFLVSVPSRKSLTLVLLLFIEAWYSVWAFSKWLYLLLLSSQPSPCRKTWFTSNLKVYYSAIRILAPHRASSSSLVAPAHRCTTVSSWYITYCPYATKWKTVRFLSWLNHLCMDMPWLMDFRFQ